MRRLAAGEVLLHIGPHKTGSTTLQLGFHRNRDRLVEQGVHYAGPKSQPMTAAMVAATGSLLPTRTPEAAGAWEELVAEVRSASADRVVISSEFFCEADTAHTTAILDELGRRDIQVVITLRPLARILASQWQQYVQNMVVTGYPDWLQAILSDYGTRETPTFWRRHRHDVLVRRWAECAGPDRVTVLVVEEGNPPELLRTFEELVAVETGTLDPGDVGANRSLRHAEVELLRHFNRVWRARGWSESDYTRLVRFGAVRHLQERRPLDSEPRILTPAWAVARAREISAQVVDAVAASGVEVIGDLETLTEGLPETAVGDNDPAPDVPVEVAARFAAGLATRFAQLAFRPLDPERRIGELETSARLLAERELRRAESAARGREGVAGAGTGQLTAAVARAVGDRVRRPLG